MTHYALVEQSTGKVLARSMSHEDLRKQAKKYDRRDIPTKIVIYDRLTEEMLSR